MQLHRPFRFGVVTHNTNASLDALVARARLAEHLGYSAFLIPDHLDDQFDTPLALALVAQATSTLHIGSFVFANDFRHPGRDFRRAVRAGPGSRVDAVGV